MYRFKDERATELFSSVSPSVVRRFLVYHGANPHIYEAFYKFTKEMSRVRSHYGIRSIAERARWESDLTGNDDFKINNTYLSCYARLIMYNDRDLTGFFRIRESN